MPKKGPVTARWEKPSGKFLKVPKALLESDLSWTAQMIYIRMALLCDKEQPIFSKQEKFAALADISPSTFRANYQSLEVAGFLGLDESGDCWVLKSVPDEMEEVDVETYVEEEEEEEEEEMDMVNSVKDMARRPRSNLTAAARWALARDAWNRWKPSNWPLLKGKETQGMIAVCIYLKKLNLEHDDYDILFRNVLLAVAQDDWWINLSLIHI